MTAIKIRAANTLRIPAVRAANLERFAEENVFEKPLLASRATFLNGSIILESFDLPLLLGTADFFELLLPNKDASFPNGDAAAAVAARAAAATGGVVAGFAPVGGVVAGFAPVGVKAGFVAVGVKAGFAPVGVKAGFVAVGGVAGFAPVAVAVAAGAVDPTTFGLVPNRFLILTKKPFSATAAGFFFPNNLLDIAEKKRFGLEFIGTLGRGTAVFAFLFFESFLAIAEKNRFGLLGPLFEDKKEKNPLFFLAGSTGASPCLVFADTCPFLNNRPVNFENRLGFFGVAAWLLGLRFSKRLASLANMLGPAGLAAVVSLLAFFFNNLLVNLENNPGPFFLTCGFFVARRFLIEANIPEDLVFAAGALLFFLRKKPKPFSLGLDANFPIFLKKPFINYTPAIYFCSTLTVPRYL